MLTELQTKKLSWYFQAFDADKSGTLEKGDFEEHAVKMVASRDAVEGSPEHRWVHAKWMKVWEALVAVADKDADGRVDLDEWLGYHDAQLQAETPYWREVEAGGYTSVEYMFDLVDQDGSGEISWKEYSLLLRAYNVPAEQHEAIFAKLDLNGDGKLSRDEWIKIVDQFFGDDAEAPGNWMFGAFDA